MKQIIIADDDAGLRDIFRLILNRAGYSVTLFSNGESILNNEFVPPDLFILDKQLSGMDGFDICRFLKQQDATKNIPVIMISASAYIKEKVEEAGADDYIEKPFRAKTLIEMMEKYLAVPE